jgi:UDP-N-acetylmuramyl pentapeptide phosphotransferase/UDP-N-acetylglucosamine-1-phosphate transferase
LIKEEINSTNVEIKQKISNFERLKKEGMDFYHYNLTLVSAAVMSFLIVFSAIPTILKVARTKNLFAEPNNRTVHRVKIPTLGGLAIFIGFMFAYTFFTDWFDLERIPFIVPSLLIIFAIGIKDDILITAPVVKLMGQILAAFIIVGIGGVQITDFHGFFGIKPNELVSLCFTILLFTFVTNGFNLIDGIDGQAAIVGIVSVISFGFWFYINEQIEMPLMAVTIVGSLVAFIYYNVFSKKQKIFMGDTGSLLIGFVLTVFAVKFMEMNIQPNNLKYSMTSAPAVAIAILIVPITDTLRVFFLRLSHGKSPFTADKNHIHHRMLSLGYSHIQISLTVGLINTGFVVLAYSLKDIGTLKLSLLILLLGFMTALIPSVTLRLRKRKQYKLAMKSRKEHNDMIHHLE